MIYTIGDLHKKSKELNYPKNVMYAVPEMNGFFKFFPGGYGTTDKSIGSVQKDYIFLGQDFGTKELYERPNATVGNKNKNISVVNIAEFTKDIGIEQKDCFFTNAIMGVRVGGSSIGKSPGWAHPDFMKQCYDFLKIQIDTIKPKFVFVMGKETAHFVAETFEIEDWRKIKNIRALFGPEKRFLKTVNNGKTKLIFMTHPSFRPTNIKKKWGIGNDEELKLSREVIES